MTSALSVLLPPAAGNSIRGSKLPFYLLIVVAAIGTVRSLIHIFSADGGAGSIAGMDLSAGASGIIFAFALWGSSQLIYAVLQWIVIVRYRALVPLMWGVQLLEISLRMLVGRLKPFTFAHTPPGAYGNYVLLILSIAMLALALWSGMTAAPTPPEK
jgi:hypothetical protein